MGIIKYIKSFFISEEQSYSWLGCLIIFTDNKKLILDKGFILTGDFSKIPYYCNFSNFSKRDGKLYYNYPNGIRREIDPEKVHLHIKIGKINKPVDQFPLNSWSLFFSSPNNKIYKSITHFMDEDHLARYSVKKSKKNVRIKDIDFPYFLRKQFYGFEMDQAVFSKLDLNYF